MILITVKRELPKGTMFAYEHPYNLLKAVAKPNIPLAQALSILGQGATAHNLPEEAANVL
jgi:hypothetical protein